MSLCYVQTQAIVVGATALGLICMHWSLSSGLLLVTLAAGFALWNVIVAACQSLRQLVMVPVSWMMYTLCCLPFQQYIM